MGVCTMKGFIIWLLISGCAIASCKQVGLPPTKAALTRTLGPKATIKPLHCNVQRTSKVVALDCTGDHLSSILETARSFGDRLVALNVHYCLPGNNVSLDSTSFVNITNLKHLKLYNCYIANILPDTFQNLSFLFSLGLRSNSISVLMPGTFQNLQKLSNLDIGWNKITSFTSDLFYGLSSLTTLHLLVNQVSVLPQKPFVNLGNLTVLNLANNLLSNLDDDAFEGLDKLLRLDLGNNKIRVLRPEALRYTKDLKKLSISWNNLKYIDEKTFMYTPKLTYLDVSRNSDSFSMDNRTLLGLTMLETFNCSYNREVSTFFRSDSVFNGLKKLREVSLDNIPFDHIKNLRLNNLFRDQVNSLRCITMVNCGITNDMLGIFQNLNALERLGLSRNQIGYIERSSLPHRLSGIRLLDLSNNKIVSVAADAFKGMQSRSVVLQFNPLDCSCNQEGFVHWLQKDNKTIVRKIEWVTCGSPISRYGTLVKDYHPIWWQCSQYMPLVALVFIIAFLLTVLLVASVIYCNRVNIKHWLLERKMARVPREEEPEPASESDRLLNPAGRNSLRQGKTGAFLIHDIYDRPTLDWVNKYVEEKLYYHSMRITLQFPAGPEVHPLWKQVKDFSFQVNAFLVLVTDDFLKKHWPEMSEKSGVEHLMKCVFVLIGKKKSDLPKDMRRLGCAILVWPETGSRLTRLEREREQFWKELRIAILGMHQ